MATTQRLRVGILGCGKLGSRHAGHLATLPEVAVVACCDFEVQRAQDLAEAVTGGQAAVFTSSRELLAQAELDALYICLPPVAHEDEVEGAAARGIHIFMEKPIALHSEQAWRMVRAVEGAAVKSQVGFMYRFGEAVEHLKQLLDGGQAGQVGMLATRWYDSDRRQHPLWMHDRTQSGGLLLEATIHHVDLHRYLLGEVEQVYAQVRFTRLHPGRMDYNLEDVAALVFQFRSGAIGVITTGDCPIPLPRGHANGELLAERLSATLQVPLRATVHPAGAAAPYEVGPVGQGGPEVWGLPYRRESEDFVAAIREDRPTRTPLREGALTQALVEAAHRSAVEGRPVRPQVPL